MWYLYSDVSFLIVWKQQAQMKVRFYIIDSLSYKFFLISPRFRDLCQITMFTKIRFCIIFKFGYVILTKQVKFVSEKSD